MSKNLTERVKRVREKLSKDAGLSKEALDAIALADKFPSVQPDVYVLPLDAMAGFCAAEGSSDPVLAVI